MVEHRITPPAELDPLTSDELLAAVERIPASDVVVVDFSDVTFCDSSGIRALLNARRRQHEAGGSLRVASAGHAVRRVFEIARVDDVLLGPPD
jgi:anti-sigma B factor antagonist